MVEYNNSFKIWLRFNFIFLANIVEDLKRQVENLSDIGNRNQKVSYNLSGKIIVESKRRLETIYDLTSSGDTRAISESSDFKSIYFQGRLSYIVENGASKIRFIPVNNPDNKRSFIINMIEEMIENTRYNFSYDEKADTFKIESYFNLEEELKNIEKIFGKPTMQKFKI